MCNIPIKVSAHTSLISSKGVIRSRDLEGVSEDEMRDNLSSQGVSAVKRIHIRRNNENGSDEYLHSDILQTSSHRLH